MGSLNTMTSPFGKVSWKMSTCVIAARKSCFQLILEADLQLSSMFGPVKRLVSPKHALVGPILAEILVSFNLYSPNQGHGRGPF
jgi:hypothetical protein